MSKQQINITKKVMAKIEKGQVRMRSKWYFILASLFTIVGFIGLIVMSVFLVSLISFSLKTHGPMGAVRYQQLMSDFPLWALALTIVGLGTGVFILKKYDFSYKHNFLFIIFIFITSILLSGFLIDYFDIDSLWMRQGPMKKMYQRYDGGYRKGYERRNNLKNFDKQFNKKGKSNFYK